jgi:hypothetical protein
LLAASLHSVTPSLEAAIHTGLDGLRGNSIDTALQCHY